MQRARCMPNPSIAAFIVPEITAFKHTLRCRKRFHTPVTYLPTNLIYPLTLQVTGINTQIRKVYAR